MSLIMPKKPKEKSVRLLMAQKQKTLLALFMALLAISTTFTWWINTRVDLPSAVLTPSGSSGEQRHQQRASPLSIFGTNDEPSTRSPSFTVDILSVGSIQRLDLLQAQQQTMGTHISVRNFFNVTEEDDADPNCHQMLTWNEVKQVVGFCRQKKDSRGWNRETKLSPIQSYMKRNYAAITWLKKKKNPARWLCAQPRPYAGLMKAFMHYRGTREALPHYLLVVDDDTYFNMELFQKNFEMMDSSQDLYHAGCLVRSPTNEVNFTFPFGGFGSILNEGVLRNLFQRIECPNNLMLAGNNNETMTWKDSDTCNRLAEDNVGERRYFKSGMNFVELMYKYANTEKYREVTQWTSGFCMHSDWVIGYFFNYYNISKHVADPVYRDISHARLESYLDSELGGGEKTGLCRNDGIYTNDTAVCHRATAKWMEEETDRWMEEETERLSSASHPLTHIPWLFKLVWAATATLGLIYK